ncbi:MAG: DUF1634 domain-containing protein [Gemmatimonadota bacterium]
METFLGNLLRVGVAVSVAFLVAGIAVTLSRHPDYLADRESLARLTRLGADFPKTLPDIGRELLELRGRAVMTAGLLFLILTPVARVAASVVGFTVERNWRFVAITSFVLLVVVTSFLLGKAG